MDGSAATAAIRSIEQDRNANRPAYIVALTGLAAEKDRQLAFESGVDHFLTKPVSLKQLDIVVEDWEKRNAVKSGLKSDILQNKLVDTMEEGYML
jgi:CheY-like chemotaxis protein